MSDNRSSQTVLPQDNQAGAEPFAATRQLSGASLDVASAWTEARVFVRFRSRPSLHRIGRRKAETSQRRKMSTKRAMRTP